MARGGGGGGGGGSGGRDARGSLTTAAVAAGTAAAVIAAATLRRLPRLLVRRLLGRLASPLGPGYYYWHPALLPGCTGIGLAYGAPYYGYYGGYYGYPAYALRR